jgi:hypothetical protein
MEGNSKVKLPSSQAPGFLFPMVQSQRLQLSPFYRGAVPEIAIVPILQRWKVLPRSGLQSREGSWQGLSLRQN